VYDQRIKQNLWFQLNNNFHLNFTGEVGVIRCFTNNNNDIYFALDSWSISRGYSNSTITQKWLVVAQY